MTIVGGNSNRENISTAYKPASLTYKNNGESFQFPGSLSPLNQKLEGEEDVEFEDGEFFVTGAPDRSISIQEAAAVSYGTGLPEGVETGLVATTFFDPSNFMFPFGAHIAIVSVDPSTGEVQIERYVAVDNVGTQINPKLVEGQIHGGVVQGIGQALLEGAVYDNNGNLLTASLQDYAVPRAANVPEL